MKTWFNKNRSLALRSTGTLLALILLVVLLYNSGWEEVWTAVQKIPALNLVLALGCVIASRLLITARWHVLLRSAGVKIPFNETISLVFTGLFANNFLPTTIGGDVVRLAGAIQLGYDQAVILASIAADRLINVIGMCLAAPMGLVQLVQTSAFEFFVLGSLWQKGWDLIRRTFLSFKLWMNKPSSLLLALCCALFHMLFSFSANYILLIGMGESLVLWKVIGLFSLSYFVSLIPVSINGYGVQELTVTFLLSHFGGVSLPASATIAVLHRLLMMLVSLPGAITLPGVMAGMDRSRQENS